MLRISFGREDAAAVEHAVADALESGCTADIAAPGQNAVGTAAMGGIAELILNEKQL
jgi:hypothetical protein